MSQGKGPYREVCEHHTSLNEAIEVLHRIDLKVDCEQPDSPNILNEGTHSALCSIVNAPKEWPLGHHLLTARLFDLLGFPDLWPQL